MWCGVLDRNLNTENELFYVNNDIIDYKYFIAARFFLNNHSDRNFKFGNKITRTSI